MDQLTRAQILDALRQALEPQDDVLAMWEGGAAAFGRLDAWSDIDLMVVVKDQSVDHTFELLEQTLMELSPIDLKYSPPQLPWPGIHQNFYRLRDAGPFLLVDAAVLQESAPEKLLTPEIHAKAVVYFDKTDVVQAPPFNWPAWQKQMEERLAILRVVFDLFQSLSLKELNRGNWLEALSFYQGYTLRPLVEALRICYKPERYNFHTRYANYDLPKNVVERLEMLFFVRDSNDLGLKRALAEEWFNQITFEKPVQGINEKQESGE
jgi:predicted nucleotidyltransferase